MEPEQKVSRVIEVSGHIIDSWILPRILDDLIDMGAEFDIQELRAGRHRTDRSYARIEITTTSEEKLATILNRVRSWGAQPVDVGEVQTLPAPADGGFPEGFFATPNLPTFVRRGGGGIGGPTPPGGRA